MKNSLKWSLRIALIFVLSCTKNKLSPTSKVVSPSAQGQFEVLTEMFEIVFQTKLQSLEFLNEYGSALQQGARVIGVYQGVTRSTTYRSLEIKTYGLRPKQLDRFCEIWELLRQKAHLPVLIEKWKGMPLEVWDGNLSFRADPRLEQWGYCLEVFKKSSPFTLRRVLSDEFLEQTEALSGDRSRLSKLYVQWVKEFEQFGIDFGLQERNKSPVDFHNRWAQEASLDKIQWELLSRVYRVLK